MKNQNNEQNAQDEIYERRVWYENSTHWIKHFRNNAKYGHIVFKKLHQGFCGYPPFYIDESLTLEVDLETFIKSEVDRIPLFIGTQFGIFPKLFEIPDFFDDDKIIAILGESLLSGTVAGLSLYVLPAGTREYTERIKIASYKNYIHEVSFDENNDWCFDYCKWIKSCKCWHVQGLFNRYTQENPNMTFEEFIMKYNRYYNDMPYAKFLIKLWHREKDKFLR